MKNKKLIYYILYAVFGTIFLVCAVMLGAYVMDRLQSQPGNNGLMGSRPQVTTRPTIGSTAATTVPGTTATTSPSIPIPSTGPSIPSIPTEPTTTVLQPPPPPTTVTTVPPPTILPELQNVHSINPHVVGRVMIEGTYIDYPVLQTPDTAQWRDYYLYRDIYGNDSNAGCIYVREACDVFTPSDNVVVYGHHMKILPGLESSSMFGQLNYYWSRGEKFLNAHKYIYFDTLYERHTYEIFAVFVTSGTYGVGYPYHLFVNAKDAADFDKFITDVKSMSKYDIDITPQYGDKLLCLSTCHYSVVKNGRLVVVAVRID